MSSASAGAAHVAFQNAMGRRRRAGSWPILWPVCPHSPASEEAGKQGWRVGQVGRPLRRVPPAEPHRKSMSSWRDEQC